MAKITVKKKKIVKKVEAPEPPVADPPSAITKEDLAKLGFSIPKGLEAQTKKALELRFEGEEADKHLGVILTSLKLENAHLNVGKDFKSFCENNLVLSEAHATDAMRLVTAYHEMGAAPELFKKVSAGHIRLMYRGFRAGVFSRKDIAKTCLPKATYGDDKYHTKDRFKLWVDQQIAKKAGDTGAVLKRYLLIPQTGKAEELIEGCFQAIKSHPTWSGFSQSQILEKALIDFTAANLGEGGGRPYLSLSNAVDLTAALCPPGLAPVLLVSDENVVPDSIKKDVHATKLPWTLQFDKANNRVMVTTNAARAKAMGAPAPVEVPYTIDASLISKSAGSLWGVPGVTVVPTPPMAEPETAPVPEQPAEPEPEPPIQKKKPSKADSKAKAKAPAPKRGRIKEVVEEAPEEAPVAVQEPATPAPAEGAATADEDLLKEITAKVRANLEVLGTSNVLSRLDYVQKDNSIPPETPRVDRLKELLKWTNDLRKKHNL